MVYANLTFCPVHHKKVARRGAKFASWSLTALEINTWEGVGLQAASRFLVAPKVVSLSEAPRCTLNLL